MILKHIIYKIGFTKILIIKINNMDGVLFQENNYKIINYLYYSKKAHLFKQILIKILKTYLMMIKLKYKIIYAINGTHLKNIKQMYKN